MVIMPSGARRASNIFGVVKGADGARVLRSGRRLFPESGEAKLRRGSDDPDEWFHSATLKGKENILAQKDCKFTRKDGKFMEEAPEIVSEESKKARGNTRRAKRNNGGNWVRNVKSEAKKKDVEIEHNVGLVDREKRMFGVVYTRKRQRNDGENLENSEDKMFGIHFSRRQRTNKGEDGENLDGFEPSAVITAVVERSSGYEFERFLSLVLMYMKRVNFRLSELSAFLCSDPISTVFSSSGIRFLMVPSTSQLGVCKFFGLDQFVPMFSVDFSAIPFCFMSLHVSLALRLRGLSYVLTNNRSDVDTSEEEMTSDSEIDDSTEMRKGVFELKSSGSKLVLHPSVRASRLAGKNSQYRNSLNYRGIQKRRSSHRRRRARNLSGVGMHKANGALVSDLITCRKNGTPFSAVVSKNKLSTSSRSSPATKLKKVTPALGMTQDMVGVTQDMDSYSCSANILVIEADRCYRIEGASITLEISDSSEWVVAVKKDGSTRYTLLAQKNMRIHSFNRVTHDIIWTVDENWRLEFPNKQDWFIFKDLYKECSDRNVTIPNFKTIPVPGVLEVPGYEDDIDAPFCRPEEYISVSNDEIARALVKRTANYDMDSEDEEWLRRFNKDLFVESKNHEHLSEDNLELMIDAFEKALYCSSDDSTDVNAVLNLCVDLGRREVIEAVYGYWMRKRKQKKSSLLRVFQVAKKVPLIPKPALRKRRSFKRYVSQVGRGKQPKFLRVMAAGNDALEEQNARYKVEEAKNAAMRAMESAIQKRRRAQALMENADLATYKAAMAITMAGVADSITDVATQFLDELV